jgi:chemotaxis signal transduction protein
MNAFYNELKIEQGSTLFEIKKASRKLLLKYHPDLHPKNRDWAQEKTKKILYAYDVLTKDISKKELSFKTKEDYENTPPKAETVTINNYMHFLIGDVNCAVPIQNVRGVETLSSLKIIKLSERQGMHPFISGVACHKDAIIPILNLGYKFKIKYTNKEKLQLLLCEIDEQSIGIVMDVGKGILAIKEKTYFNNNENSCIPKRYLSGIINHEAQDVYILNIESILIA